jgi:hypothetical protein
LLIGTCPTRQSPDPGHLKSPDHQITRSPIGEVP